MSELPRDKSLDSTIAMLRDGYTFISKRCERLGSEAFRARLMGQQAVCMTGAEAARVFYDREKFRRGDALPKRIQKSLTGEGAVHTLDGEKHHARKAMFMSFMSTERVQRFNELFISEWRRAVPEWERRGEIVLFEEAEKVLFLAACEWTGVPVDDADAGERAPDFSAMVDGFGGVGPRHWRGRRGRARGEAWVSRLVERARDGESTLDPESPAAVIAHYREVDGELLDAHTAAVEIINLLRPIVAIAFYLVFVGLALHRYPEARRKLQASEDGRGYSELFVQEVRRFYPFTPFVGARVKQQFEWRGHSFQPGELVLLDVYGIDHDPELWPDPEAFRPERFREWDGSRYDFVPQGGGEYHVNHRCPGEWITVEAMRSAALMLTNELDYDVPEQDLEISLSRMPARPASGFVMRNVRSRAS